MNVKHREKPYSLLTYEALFRRLNPNLGNSDFINSGYLTSLAGYRGERDVDYKLSQYPLKNSYVLQGLRLKSGPHYFQIDTLILTRNFFCILEIKNIKGELEYDSDFKQLTQKVGNEMKGIKNPIYQAEAQKRNLESLLQDMQIFNIPIDYLVVISNPRTILKCRQQDQEVFDKMIHAESLANHLDKLIPQYNKEVLTKATLKKANDFLLNNQTPHLPQLIKQHRLNDQQLIKGIICPTCQSFPMKRSRRTWLCEKCLNTHKDAHKQTILDYFLLYDKKITNKKCREILMIDSDKIAYNLLTSMNLERFGDNRGRVYLSPNQAAFPQNSFVPSLNKNGFY
ncbi:nuclease-related domain-containing protein [Virgibacillus sp. DJP39]|uniref:nuclease-related domain-containing protein n=1 Tax=Virgibacillus sp. DJP39 TaxID=3409790 RepID=UPI003BB574F6